MRTRDKRICAVCDADSCDNCPIPEDKQYVISELEGKKKIIKKKTIKNKDIWDGE